MNRRSIPEAFGAMGPGLDRRRFLMSGVAISAAGLLASAVPLVAQDLPQLQLFVPGSAGGGWDQTARAMEQVLRAEGLIAGAQVTNVPGAGGTVGLPQFVNQYEGRDDALMVAGMVMVGSSIANNSANTLADVTPIARLTGEYLAVVVPADSPFQTLEDFVAALKADPASVPVAGGSAGGSDHILLGLIAQSVGVPATSLSYVGFAGGGEAMAALLGNQVAAGISGYGEFAEQIETGALRALAISADVPQEGIDVPTLKEAGVDVELFNWRALFAPPGISEEDRTDLVQLVETMAASEAWQTEAANRNWTQILLTGDEFAEFLTAESDRIRAILEELGLA